MTNSGGSHFDCSQRMSSFAKLLAFIVTSKSRDDLLSGLPKRIATLLNCECCHAFTYDAEKGVLHLMGRGHYDMPVSLSLAETMMQLPIDRSVSGEAIRNKGYVCRYNLHDLDSGFFWREFLQETGCHGVLSVPILDKDLQAIGGINLYTVDEYREFAPEEVDMITSVALSVGQKMMNLRALNKAEAFREVTELCAKSVRSQDILDRVAELARTQTNTLAADIFLWDAQKWCLVLAGTTGLTTREGVPITDYSQAVYQKGEGITGYVAATHEPIRIIDEDDKKWVCSRRKGLFHAGKYLHSAISSDEATQINFLAVPVMHGNNFYGVLRLVGKEGRRPINHLDQSILEEIARQMGVFLAADAVTAQREKERQQQHEAFLAAAAHQLLSPIGAMRSHCHELISLELMSTERRVKVGKTLDAWCEMIANVAYNFSTLREVLTNSNFPMQKKRVELSAMLIHVAALLQPSAWERDIKIYVVTDEQGFWPVVEADERLLIQVFMNLVHNAVKYSKPSSQIVLSLDKMTQELCTVRIRNTGIPIKGSEIERIFEVEYRTIHAQALDPNGTGLGLPIARAIARLHSGDIYAQCESLKDKTGWADVSFLVRLPVAKTVSGERRT